MSTVAVPERTDDQRLGALRIANQIRAKRKRLKDDLKSGDRSVVSVIAKPPPFALSMRAYDLLLATPKVGKVKADAIIRHARISPSKTLGGLTERQRRELVALIASRLPRSVAA